MILFFGGLRKVNVRACVNTRRLSAASHHTCACAGEAELRKLTVVGFSKFDFDQQRRAAADICLVLDRYAPWFGVHFWFRARYLQ